MLDFLTVPIVVWGVYGLFHSGNSQLRLRLNKLMIGYLSVYLLVAFFTYPHQVFAPRYILGTQSENILLLGTCFTLYFLNEICLIKPQTVQLFSSESTMFEELIIHIPETRQWKIALDKLVFFVIFVFKGLIRLVYKYYFGFVLLGVFLATFWKITIIGIFFRTQI